MYTYEYARPMVCTDVVLFEKIVGAPVRILLIQRKNDPFRDHWALPGGFIEMEEDLEPAARRELIEETGVSTGALLQVGAFGNPARDPRGRNISVAFCGVSCEPIVCRAGDDAKSAQMFSLDALPPLAFDHEEIIHAAIEMLKRRQKWEN